MAEGSKGILGYYKFEPIFKSMDELFDLIKEELFMDEWVREKTRIVFVQTNYPNKGEPLTQRCVYFYQTVDDRKNGYQVTEQCLNSMSGLKEGRQHKEDEVDEVMQAVDDWVCNNCESDQKWLQRACTIEMEEHQVSIWCICYSVCLSENRGKRLLELTFRKWLDKLEHTGWYSLIEMKNQKPSSEPFIVERMDGRHKFVREVLQEASWDMRTQIQTLYAPIEISDIMSLSGEYYEKVDCQSNLLFLPPGKEGKLNKDALIYDFRGMKKEKCALDWQNIRLMRKLSQIAQKELCLLFTAGQDGKDGTYEVLGICRWTDISRQETDAVQDMDVDLQETDSRKPLLLADKEESIPYLIIKIGKHMQFDIFFGDTYILTCSNGNDKIRLGLPQNVLEDVCRKTFGGDCGYTSVLQGLLESQKQSHGTMIVILDKENAEKEAKRLSDKGFGIKNAMPKEAPIFINQLNAIDGSVIMDTDGKIYGIGMILDGSSKSEGDIAKGARHNSANKYHDYLLENKMRGIILVVSEDGAAKILSSTA
ncbi:MAG: hypothetical protein HDR15_08605 [Lachnospiraceae bacterium]|nr:hypothetical protein [Lachnospiraceae bacterium]